MSLFVKICGLTDHGAVETCVESGVDAIGFVFAESPRRVEPGLAAELSSLVPAGIARVAVFRRPRPGDIDRVLDVFMPDVVQADHDHLSSRSDVRVLPVYRETVDSNPEHRRFLYEGAVSGVGQLVDLERAAGVASLGEMVLAGGLRPDNVGRAIAMVKPFGVDVSSGVESEPGVKSPALIRSFVTAARVAGERLVSA
ncbi:MAG: phosphoribosylanthranilate isomerase [Acidimicrobiia bacterium]